MAWDPATFAGPTGPSIPFQYTYFIILFAGVAFLAVLFGFGSPRGVGCLNYLCCSRCCTSTRRKGGRSSGGDGNSWNTSAGTATAVAPASENDDVEMSRMNPVEHDAPQPLQPQPQPGAAAADSAATAAAVPAVLPTTTSAARVTVTVLKILSRFSGVLAVFFSTTTIIVLVGWNLLPWVAGAFISWLWTAFAYAEFVVSERDSLRGHYSQRQNNYGFKLCGAGKTLYRNRAVRRWVDLVVVSILGLAMFVVCWSISGLCIGSVPWTASTTLSRRLAAAAGTAEQTLQQGPYCRGGVAVPCHVYLTLAADLQTSVFVNYHTTTAQPTQVRLARVSKSNADGGGGGGGEVPAVVLVTGTSSVWAIETERWIHTVLLSNLSPDSTYRFTAGTVDAQSKSISFKTAPSNPAAAISFIEGGDAGNAVESNQLSAIAASVQPPPLFAVVGGDISYANNFPTCYPVWDKWLADWERLMVTTEGHAIPMTVAVGNHESSQESWGDQLAASKVTSYFDLFAQEEEEDRASNPRSRTTRQVHMVGPSLGMVVLDSRHVVTWESQVSWFEEQLAPNTPLSNAPIKLAIYHMPLYSAIDRAACKFGDIGKEFRRGQNAWIPTLDANNFTAAFEHHVHVFKRTKPLRNFSVAAEGVHGTVYLGGGAWGAPLAGASTVEGPGVTICSEEVRAADPRVGETGWFTEKASNDFNVFHGVAVLSEDGSMLSLRAFDAENNTLDFVNITA